MPKKKKFRKNDRKNQEILIEQEKMEDNAETTTKSTTQETKESRPLHEQKPSLIPKKRSSFSKKKKYAVQTDSDNAEEHAKVKKKLRSAEKVKRSSSFSLNDSSRSKIPLPKYRTLQHSKGRYLSPSCSNFESRSMVLNPGMDDWRMSGLLDTVEKSNSMCALNISASNSNISESSSPKIALDSTPVSKRIIQVTLWLLLLLF